MKSIFFALLFSSIASNAQAAINWEFVLIALIQEELLKLEKGGELVIDEALYTRERYADALEVRAYISRREESELQNLRVAKAICSAAPCGLLTEKMAGEIVALHVSEQRAKKEIEHRREEVWISRINLVVAMLAMMTSWLAHRKSKTTESRLQMHENLDSGTNLVVQKKMDQD